MAIQAFYGGTFDPIHQGHLQLALFVLEYCTLDSLQLVPCHIPPHRDRPASSSLHRSAMVQLAIAPYPQLKLNPLELVKEAPSYTVETLAQLRQDYPSDQLLWLIGMDSLCQFTQWHRWLDILHYAHLLVCQRPGYTLNQSAQQLLQQYGVNSYAQLKQQPSGGIFLLPNPLFDISASAIRAQRQSSEKHVSTAMQIPAVVRYIEQHQLYR